MRMFGSRPLKFVWICFLHLCEFDHVFSLEYFIYVWFIISLSLIDSNLLLSLLQGTHGNENNYNLNL